MLAHGKETMRLIGQEKFHADHACEPLDLRGSNGSTLPLSCSLSCSPLSSPFHPPPPMSILSTPPPPIQDSCELRPATVRDVRPRDEPPQRGDEEEVRRLRLRARVRPQGPQGTEASTATTAECVARDEDATVRVGVHQHAYRAFRDLLLPVGGQQR